MKPFPLGRLLVTYLRLTSHLESVRNGQLSLGLRAAPLNLHLVGAARRLLPQAPTLDLLLQISRIGPGSLDGFSPPGFVFESPTEPTFQGSEGALPLNITVVHGSQPFGGLLISRTGPQRFTRTVAQRLFHGDIEQALTSLEALRRPEHEILLDALGVWVSPERRDRYAFEHFA